MSLFELVMFAKDLSAFFGWSSGAGPLAAADRPRPTPPPNEAAAAAANRRQTTGGTGQKREKHHGGRSRGRNEGTQAQAARLRRAA